MRRSVWLGVLLSACGATTVTPVDAGDDGTGVDEALTARCVGCHAAVGERWKQVSSHSLLFDCAQCHVEQSATPGPGHQSKRACGECHSAQEHHGFSCVGCHDQHGSANLFLVRETLAGKPVTLTSPTGLDATGLARGTGAGVCETCHTATAHDRSDGAGPPHHAAWCITCHGHDRAFSP